VTETCEAKEKCTDNEHAVGGADALDLAQAEVRRLKGELAQRDRDLQISREAFEGALALRDQLADDALVALAGAGIATPEQTYKVEPYCLEGDIKRLAKERDDARVSLNVAKKQIEGQLRMLEQERHTVASLQRDAKAERDGNLELRGAFGARADETFPEFVQRLHAEKDKALRFKEYVHRRLDYAGVPTDPPSPHRKHGCRIGGRLDWLLLERDAGDTLVEFVRQFRVGLALLVGQFEVAAGAADRKGDVAYVDRRLAALNAVRQVARLADRSLPPLSELKPEARPKPAKHPDNWALCRHDVREKDCAMCGNSEGSQIAALAKANTELGVLVVDQQVRIAELELQLGNRPATPAPEPREGVTPPK
jgi:hypothetical protein